VAGLPDRQIRNPISVEIADGGAVAGPVEDVGAGDGPVRVSSLAVVVLAERASEDVEHPTRLLELRGDQQVGHSGAVKVPCPHAVAEVATGARAGHRRRGRLPHVVAPVGRVRQDRALAVATGGPERSDREVGLAVPVEVRASFYLPGVVSWVAEEARPGV